MASPLSPSRSNTLNQNPISISSPPTVSSQRYDNYEVEAYTTTTTTITTTSHSDADDSDTSSPFMSQVQDNQENAPPPPTKLRPASRVLSGAELSPLRLLQDRPSKPAQRSSLGSTEESVATAPPPPRSPRKMSAPDKRFPVRVSTAAVVSPTAEETPRTNRFSAQPVQAVPQSEPHKRTLSLEEAVRENEGLSHAIDIFEDNASVLDDTLAGDADTAALGQREHDSARVDCDDEPAAVDDTMVSTFSTFSAVPNLTMFANMRAGADSTASPSKPSSFGPAPLVAPGGPKPDLSPLRTPRAANGPLPNRQAVYESGNTTNLLDFTPDLRRGAYHQTPSSPPRRGGRTSPAKGMGGGVAATPQRNSGGNALVDLLDFDIPPLPTPRSIPSVTPRELESLKSNFLSEISSLKASLSGKEAEAQSLKTAVGDAEKRVGQCMEQLREAKAAAEALAAEKEGWEKRGREMEAVLRKVKEEIVLSQRDREELEARLEESEKRRDAAETMAQEAESKMAGMRAGKASAEAAAAAARDAGTPAAKSPTGAGAGSNKEVEIAVERVARELHALYKSKHETKVAALRKSYENRWEKRVRELEARIEELGRENEELRVGRDATITRLDIAAVGRVREEMEEERKKERKRNAELEAEVERLEAVVRSVQADNQEIRGLLERERIEKGELVLLAEEMMSMQSFVGGSESERDRTPARPVPASARKVGATPSKAGSGVTGIRAPASPSPAESGLRGTQGASGVPRASGLRAPAAGVGASRIGKVGVSAHGRTGSVVSGSGVPRPGSGLGTRSGGLLSSIEKMGSYRGRAE